MKSIKNLLKSTGKTIAKAGVGLALSAMPYVAQAGLEDMGSYDHNGVEDYEWINLFRKPDVHYKYLGKKKYEYYASSDVNNNGIPGESADAQAIRNGVKNDMADVNADGKVDEKDAKMIDDYVAGTGKLIGIDYWDPQFSVEKRKKFIYDLYNNVYIPSFGDKVVINAENRPIIYMEKDGDIIRYDCGNYSEQAIQDFKGYTHPEEFVNMFWEKSPRSVFRTSNNARFNIQVCEGSQTTASGGAHSVIRFPVGDDLKKWENWYTIDAQTGHEAGIGTRFMRDNQTVTINWNGCTKRWGPIRTPPILDFTITNGVATPTWENPYSIYNRSDVGVENNTVKTQKLDLEVSNPITDKNSYLKISTQNPGKTKLEVYNINGKKLEQRVFNTIQGENTEDFNFSKLTPGMYIFRAIGPKGNIDSEKVVKK